MEETKKSTLLKDLLTVLLGMSITLIRVVMPTHLEITPWLVILEAALELVVCAAVVLLHRKFLAGVFREKLPKKFIDNVIVCWTVSFVGGLILVQLLGGIIYHAVTGLSFDDVLRNAPAAAVASAFQSAFLPGLILTTCITAPVLEEIVFRMACKRLIKNNILFVLISSLLFGFIHTASFTTLGIVDYFISGCLFAGIYLKTKDIRISIAAHIMYNTMLYVFMLIRWIISLFGVAL